MPKKRPLNVGDLIYLKEKTKNTEKVLFSVKLAWAHYLKKDDPLRVELDDLYRRYKVFSDSSAKFLED